MIPVLLACAAWESETGIPLPYSPRTDVCTTTVLLCCFFISAYVLAHSRKFLMQQADGFLLHRERPSIFATSTGSEMRYMLILIIQACILAGLYLFICFVEGRPALVAVNLPTCALLGAYIAVCCGYILAKWLSYILLGWIFLDKKDKEIWLESYSTLIHYVGFFLFLQSLSAVYFDLSLIAVVTAGLLLLFLVKLLMLYKWLRLFCRHFYGCFLLILYFCALEIIPCMLLYKGLLRLNDYWIINY